MHSQRTSKLSSLILTTSIAAICIIALLVSLVASQEYENKQKSISASPVAPKLPRSLPQQRLFRGIRRRKMGIRKRKQISATPTLSASPSTLPQYVLTNADTNREEKKIEQENGKLVRRKIMRRKRPLPTVMSPLPYQGNRRVSSQQQFAPNFNLTVNTPNFATIPANPNGNAIKKVRRKKIPVVVSSSNVVTYEPKTTPMLPMADVTIAEQENALNRTEEEKRFLSLFTIVTFKNDACASTSGSNGTCYSSSDCSKLGGTASGTCASGFGVCCLCK